MVLLLCLRVIDSYMTDKLDLPAIETILIGPESLQLSSYPYKLVMKGNIGIQSVPIDLGRLISFKCGNRTFNSVRNASFESSGIMHYMR